MNILIAMNSKISPTSGGIERTTLNLFEYLNNQDDFKAYGLFNDFAADAPFKENIYKGIIKDATQIKEILIDKNIDILYFPAGPWYTLIGYKAIEGTNCKIVTAYHSKYNSKEFVFKNKLISKLNQSKNLKIRLLSLFKLLFYPIFFQKNYKYWQKLMQQGYEKSDAFVLLSDKYINPLFNHYKLKDKKKLYGIGNALSFKEFSSIEDIKNKKNQLLVVGRLKESSKRISVAIKSWANISKKYPNWELIIVGDGNDRAYYEKLKSKYNIQNLIFEGRQNPENYYRESKIFLMTSAIEGWGMTITEAMQFGCVPICIDSFEALHEIIDSFHNGIIIPDDKDIIKNLIANIELLINNNSIRENMAINSIESSKRFSMDKIGIKWIQLFNNLKPS